MQRAAYIDGKYRYSLTRQWRDDIFPPPVCFILLNPSTADAEQDDPTVRRCVGFAKDWGFGAVMMVNLFAFRATDPASVVLAGQTMDVVGPKNFDTLNWVLHSAAKVIAAWGAAPWAQKRAREVLNHFVSIEFLCLRITKSGAPQHPLYLPKDLKPVVYRKALCA